MIDYAAVKFVAEIIGLAGAAFAGGMLGQTKAIKALQEDVAMIKVRLGIAHTPKPKNGPTADLGRADGPTVLVTSVERKAKS